MEEQAKEGLARSEAAFRELNELMAPQHYACECASPTCFATLELSVEQYESARSHPRRFIIRPGHESGAIERVVERHEGYWVVEKVGTAGHVALERDPRG